MRLSAPCAALLLALSACVGGEPAPPAAMADAGPAGDGAVLPDGASGGGAGEDAARSPADGAGARADAAAGDIAGEDASPPADAAGGTPGDAVSGDDGDVAVDAADAGPACVEPGATSVLGPSGYPLDGWGWTSQGVILEDPDAPPTGGLLAPSLVERDGVLHLFYTRKDATLHRIWHATSHDGGVSFTPSGEVTGLGDDPVLAYPSVLVEGGRFRMWVGSGTIDLAESEDGDAWTLVAESVLRPSDTGTVGPLSLLYPSVLADAAGYAMWFTGYDGSQLRIGRATSPDGVAWTVDPLAPVLSPGPQTAFDNKATASPRVVASGGRLLMWYGGYDTAKTNPGPYRVGLATSQDGVAWDKAGVSLDLPADGPDAWSTRDPAVIRAGGGWLMVYAGLAPDQRYRLLRATSPVCPEP